MASPFSEALSTLNDRALRRLLGARAYLRGYDYVRRRSVEGVVLEEAGATGHVRGNDSEVSDVALKLTPSGLSSTCTCPAFASSNGGHCKHVAALLIALRDQARGAPRQPQPQAQLNSGNGVHYTVHGGTVHVAGVDGEGRRSKRARARAMKAGHQASSPQLPRGFAPRAGSGTGVD
ncbi:MAG: SWIM zinc finger family protein, partial [Polyangiaceae bacterium]